MSGHSALVLIGPPASGKSTIARHFIECGFTVLSPGSMLRQEAKKDTQVGLKARQLMERGDIIQGIDIVTPMIAGRVAMTSGSLLFDGFPRATSQADALDVMLDKKGIPSERIFIVQLSLTDDAVRGYAQRRHAFNQQFGQERRDDQPDVFEDRLAKYRQYSKELTAYYGDRLKVVDGNQELDDVIKEISYMVGVPTPADPVRRILRDFRAES